MDVENPNTQMFGGTENVIPQQSPPVNNNISIGNSPIEQLAFATSLPIMVIQYSMNDSVFPNCFSASQTSAGFF